MANSNADLVRDNLQTAINSTADYIGEQMDAKDREIACLKDSMIERLEEIIRFKRQLAEAQETIARLQKAYGIPA